MITTSRLLPAAILLLAPAAAASCAQSTNTLPIENFPDAVAWKKNLTGQAKPAIVPVSSTPTPEGTVRLLLVNPTDQPIEYGGYTVESWAEAPPVGQISPLYSRGKRNAEGEWKEDPVGWCGTGADTMVVPPGHAGEFSAHVSTEGQSRVGFNLTQTSATGTTISELWSPPLGAANEEVSVKEGEAAAEEPKAEPVARSVEGASKEPNTLPIDGVPAAAAWKKNMVGEAKPAIIVSSTNPAEGTDAAQLDVRLMLVNPTDQPIEYSGYTIDSWTEPPPVGQINPRYRKETMSDGGEWKDEPIYWCKFGSARIVVPPGHAGEFDARVPANSKTRIGVNLMPTPENGLKIVELWSLTLGAGGEEVPAKAP